MSNKIYLNIMICLFLPFFGKGQELLKLEEAFAIALENNYDIKLANNTLEKANNNQSVYNSGFLPTASVNGNANYSNTNLTLTSQ